jgi:hypothetical protein
MTVYVLLGRTDYAGDTLLGVYTSDEAARAAYIAFLLEADISGFDDVIVDARELDGSADWRWV